MHKRYSHRTDTSGADVHFHLSMLGNFSYICCRLLTFFKVNFFAKKQQNTIRVSNDLDPDQDRHNVGPDLDPNCLQMLSADQKSPRVRKGLIFKVHLRIR